MKIKTSNRKIVDLLIKLKIPFIYDMKMKKVKDEDLRGLPVVKEV